MSDIILHIGLNKTGTSSIQDFMNMNAAKLLRHGMCYPTTGRDGTAHHALSRWIKVNKDDPAALESEMVKSLRKEIEGTRITVLSSEDFHTLTDRGVEMMKEILKDHRVKVVVYLREHLNYLASWYQQNVQGTHLSCAFDTFCYFNKKPLHAIVERWAAVFGKQHVSVRVYDRAQLLGGDIVQDFLEQVNPRLDVAKLKRKPYESNPSVSGNLLFAKRLINNFCDKSQAASYVHEVSALSKLKPTFAGHMLVAGDVVDAVVQSYKQDRRILAHKYGAKIPELSGVRAGHATPDLDAFAEDWALIMHTAEVRGFGFATAARVLSKGVALKAPMHVPGLSHPGSLHAPNPMSLS
ncbi:sulfotransferase domain-containing protein [Ideonella azotifigens]|uniref:Sulfotransferase domain-containing protein n=1 Tax=Ideonella azotifigens TaxID=513160 RepID=A0ABP3UVQ2_9BURK|nr:sulfotransferase domain-containing protein [Ideonella azotifigens]MCD2339657.1 sulfotransferase domain-containing protein [Ideonella azotifigens]